MRRLLLLASSTAFLFACSAVDRNFEPTGTSGTAMGGAGPGGGSASGGGGPGGASTGGGGGSGGAAPRDAYLPAAPDLKNFAWQSWQTAFVDKDQKPCTGSISIAASDYAVCFVAGDSTVKCTGQIADVSDGPSLFTIPGVTDAVSLMVTPNSDGFGDSVCVVRKNGFLMCIGEYNDAGQFGNGSMAGDTVFTRWGTVKDVRAIATGDWRELCALADGVAWCSGSRWMLTPQMVKSSLTAFWVDGNQNAQPPDDGMLFRVAAGRSDCVVDAQGFFCDGAMHGVPKHVVDGNNDSYYPPSNPSGYSRTCVLADDGTVNCTRTDLVNGGEDSYEAFSGNAILALGMQSGESLCGVLRDGSILCTGNNAGGQLGLDPTNTPYVENPETIAPPGSIDTSCR